MATSTGPNKIQQFIRDRRTQLGLTQAELASRMKINSPEFIAQVEGGHRNITLERIPSLADALQVNRQDMVKLSLYYELPQVYRILFGNTNPTKDVKEQKTYQPKTDADELLEKWESLPKESRISIRNLVNQLHANVTVQVR